MDDAEYALVTDLTRLRVALDVLRPCCPDDPAIREAVAILSERERDLAEQVADIIGQEPFGQSRLLRSPGEAGK